MIWLDLSEPLIFRPVIRNMARSGHRDWKDQMAATSLLLALCVNQQDDSAGYANHWITPNSYSRCGIPRLLNRQICKKDWTSQDFGLSVAYPLGPRIG